MCFYPLTFKPIYKEKIWGGDGLKRVFNKQLPSKNIGESWEIAAHPNGTSIISNGIFKGETITSLVSRYPEQILGKKVSSNNKTAFPLLIKFIDANKKLSVQVHPGDKYSGLSDNESGKTEMWYIIHAKPGARLIYGLKQGIDKKSFSVAIQEGNLEKCFNQLEVNRGDIIFLPPGTLHALGDGIILVEIQQNSDTTYRVYDWNRAGPEGRQRTLHINKALEVIDFNQKKTVKKKPLLIAHNQHTRKIMSACPFFITEQIDIQGKLKLQQEGSRFYVILILSGYGTISNRDLICQLEPGKTVLLPAALKEVTISGKLEMIKVYLPTDKTEITQRLTSCGISPVEIAELAGMDIW